MSAAYLKSAYAVLTIWPLLHMLLSLAFDFSPWKFMGWGMYATPFPDYQQIVAFREPVDCRGSGRPAILEQGPVIQFSALELYDWQPRGVTRIPILLPADDFAPLTTEIRRFSVLHTEASLARALVRVDRYQPALVAVLRPRIQLERELLLWDLSLYRYVNQQANLVSREATREVDPLIAIGRELGCL